MLLYINIEQYCFYRTSKRCSFLICMTPLLIIPWTCCSSIWPYGHKSFKECAVSLGFQFEHCTPTVYHQYQKINAVPCLGSAGSMGWSPQCKHIQLQLNQPCMYIKIPVLWNMRAMSGTRFWTACENKSTIVFLLASLIIAKVLMVELRKKHLCFIQ